LVERRLTFNSSASPIASAAISPDGKYLAYSDPVGIHVRLLSTGEERPIPTPAGVPASLSYVDSWFPNGTELLAHSREAGGRGSMWAVSIMGKSSQELRSDAAGWKVSPDGTRIAFGPTVTAAGREIWVMDSHGNNPQKVLGLAADEFLWSVNWSPDGKRLAYVRAHPGGQLMETSDLKGANRTAVLVAEVRSICWLPDRRIVYSQGEARDVDANLWQIGVDTATGTPIGKPKRITRWAGADLQGMSASADAKRIVLQKETYPSQVYIGELAAGGTPMSPPRRLTHDDAHDWATAWTADSKAVLFTSDRGGKWGVFRQGISQTTAEPLIEGRERTMLARLNPDGAWVLYLETSATASGHIPWQRLMRVPVNGGLPKLVSEITTAQWENHQCARSPASLCAIIESSLNHQRLTVTALDPLRGKGKLLRTINTAIGEGFCHSLSPDGSTLAIARGDEPEIHIRLLSMTGGSDREIAVKGWPNSGSMEWSADGKGIYCTSISSQGGTLLYVDLKGTARVLWHSRELDGGPFIAGVPSPDGRYLALTGAIHNSTAWMVEGF
jgi:Tol biopolymer transport system component